MKIMYDVTNAERKVLVKAISQEVSAAAEFLYAPSFAYKIGDYNVDRNGILEGMDNRVLIAKLRDAYGFVYVTAEYDSADDAVETPSQKAELINTLRLHKKWLAGEVGGVCADFSVMDLSGIDVRSMGLKKGEFDDVFAEILSNDVGLNDLVETRKKIELFAASANRRGLAQKINAAIAQKLQTAKQNGEKSLVITAKNLSDSLQLKKLCPRHWHIAASRAMWLFVDTDCDDLLFDFRKPNGELHQKYYAVDLKIKYDLSDSRVIAATSGADSFLQAKRDTLLSKRETVNADAKMEIISVASLPVFNYKSA